MTAIEFEMCKAMPRIADRIACPKARERLRKWRRRNRLIAMMHPSWRIRYAKPIGPKFIHGQFLPITDAGRMTKGVLARAIASSIARAYFVTLDDIKSKSRSQRLVEPRFAICYAIRKASGHSTSVIGRMVGRHHTSVLHALKAFQERLDRGQSLDPVPLLLPNGWTPPSPEQAPR
jgi:hypothetical protein